MEKFLFVFLWLLLFCCSGNMVISFVPCMSVWSKGGHVVSHSSEDWFLTKPSVTVANQFTEKGILDPYYISKGSIFVFSRVPNLRTLIACSFLKLSCNFKVFTIFIFLNKGKCKEVVFQSYWTCWHWSYLVW